MFVYSRGIIDISKAELVDVDNLCLDCKLTEDEYLWFDPVTKSAYLRLYDGDEIIASVDAFLNEEEERMLLEKAFNEFGLIIPQADGVPHDAAWGC